MCSASSGNGPRGLSGGALVVPASANDPERVRQRIGRALRSKRDTSNLHRQE